MTDILIALSAIAAAFALYHRIQAGRALKRLIASFTEQRAKDPDHQRTGNGEKGPRDEEKEARPG